MPTNSNGLTFSQWLRAANFARKTPMRMDLARSEWHKGVDPTEYAVED